MKNSIYTKREVPTMHPGCSMAETGASDYDDFDNPLKPFDIIPESKKKILLENEVDSYEYDGEKHEKVSYKLSPEVQNPSNIRDEPHITVVVPEGVHPFTYLKEIGVDFDKAWVFMHNEVVENVRSLPNRYHQETVAYGEFFRFEDFDTMALQKVEYFPNWKVILEGKIGEEEFYRNTTPECIIEVIMQK